MGAIVLAYRAPGAFGQIGALKTPVPRPSPLLLEALLLGIHPTIPFHVSSPLRDLSGRRRGRSVQYGTPLARACPSAWAYHSSSQKNRSQRRSNAGSVGSPDGVNASCTRGIGNSEGILDMPSSASVMRNCIAARTG